MAGKAIGAGAIEALQLTLDKGSVIVTERGDGKFTQLMLDGEHVWPTSRARRAATIAGPRPIACC